MRPRTFAREIAFQALYRDDLNPPGTAGAPACRVPACGWPDELLDQGRQTRELIEFVGQMAEAEGAADPGVAADAPLRFQWLREPALIEFTRTLVAGVREHRRELDERIAQAAAHWSVDRMAATDRNLLRLGAYELLHTEIPAKVAVDEAVELAKRFGGAQSAQFVNGILDNLMHQKAQGLEQKAEGPSQISNPKSEIPNKSKI
ncbi:MAG: transcription antitermination factor NusB [Thermoguttaceae bacterium]|jgi:N utilization substance protein B